MPIDPQTERLLSLSEAARAVPAVDGKRPHVSTLWRWIRKGSRGVRLAHVRVGHRVCTSEEALARYFVQLAEAEQTTAPIAPKRTKKRTPQRRQRDIDKAAATLTAAGI